MSQASRLSSIRRQAIGLFGNNVTAGRKPRGAHTRYQLVEEVRAMRSQPEEMLTSIVI